MKKTFAGVLALLMLLCLLSSCGISNNTDTEKDTQSNETSTDAEKDSVGKLYSQINGGKFLGKLDETIITISPSTINYSPYMLINTYDELIQLAENASEIDSSIFEENVILYVRQRYPNISGEPLGYRGLKMEDGELFITYSKYQYRLECASEAVAYYKDYIVIPKNELPNGIEQSGKISVILKPIVLENLQDINEVEEQTAIHENTAWLFKTREELDAFIASYSIDQKTYPDSEDFVIAIYIKRPERIDYEFERDITSQGYLCGVEESTLSLTYLYNEFKCGEMGYYIDFISIPSDLAENIENIRVDIKARENPAFPDGRYDLSKN